MNGYVYTPLVGGFDGTKFDDLAAIGELRGQIPFNLNHPISRIEVSHGWIVDGLNIFYERTLLGAGDASADLTTACQHGTQKRDATAVDFKSSEVILAVFGRAGYQTYYKRDMINSIGFAIFDKKTATARVVGPFGNGNGSNDGEPFHVPDVIAFGGYAKPAEQCGLAGLSFYADITGKSK